MTCNFNLMNQVYRKLCITENNITQITFYFVEEGLDRGSEDTKKECNVNCFDFSSLLSFLWTSRVEKSQST
jgi:hypothetical protein